MKKVFLIIIIASLIACAEMKPIETPVLKEEVIEKKQYVKETWNFFPDITKYTIHPKEKLVFNIEVLDSTTKIKKLSLSFGDGSSEECDVQCKNVENKWKCKPNYVEHSYPKEKLYRPCLKYTLDDGTTIRKCYKNGIPIAPVIKSDQDLKEIAYNKLISQLAKVIYKIVEDRKQINAKTRFALSVLKDANFEYNNDPKDLATIQMISKSLVKRGYQVIEKHPQVLIRLAHEAIVRVDQESGDLAKYLNTLEYGLRTTYKGDKVPFYYSIQMEGIEDKREEQFESKLADETLSGQESSVQKKESNRAANNNKSSLSQEKGTKSIVSTRNRPLLFAKFLTADYLIVVDRIEDPHIVKSQPIFYNLKYKKKMIERVAKVKYNIRILYKDGTIVWMDDLEGEIKDRVVPQFVPKKILSDNDKVLQKDAPTQTDASKKAPTQSKGKQIIDQLRSKFTL